LPTGTLQGGTWHSEKSPSRMLRRPGDKGQGEKGMRENQTAKKRKNKMRGKSVTAICRGSRGRQVNRPSKIGKKFLVKVGAERTETAPPGKKRRRA